MKNILARMYNQHGEDLYTLSLHKPLLIIFLRHFGCVFCRQTLDDIYKLKSSISELGVRTVFVYLDKDERAEVFFKKYEFSDLDLVKDSSMKFYEHFGLMKGEFRQLFGLQNWMRGFSAFTEGHTFSMPQADSKQMPGVFIVKNGEILNKFRHEMISDRPDYIQLIKDAL